MKFLKAETRSRQEMKTCNYCFTERNVRYLEKVVVNGRMLMLCVAVASCKERKRNKKIRKTMDVARNV